MGMLVCMLVGMCVAFKGANPSACLDQPRALAVESWAMLTGWHSLETLSSHSGGLGLNPASKKPSCGPGWGHSLTGS